MNQYKNEDRKGKDILVDEHYNLNGMLEDLHIYDDLPPLFDDVDDVMLASQESQGPSTPAKSHGLSDDEKDKQIPDQPPKEKTSILHYTTHIKPRLRWTPQLHARFTEAINELGGASRATPKALQTAMNLDGLTLYHVKSHLQKFRMGKVTVRELKEIPKIPSRRCKGPKNSTSRGNRPVSAKGRAISEGSKAPKATEAKQREHGQEQLHQKRQEACEKHIDDEKEKIGVPTVFSKNLAGVGTTATTPTLNSTRKNTYLKYNILERTREWLSLQNLASSSRGYQHQNRNITYSETRNHLTSGGYSFPAYNSTNANNVQVSLKEKSRSFLPQDAASGTTSLMASLGFSFPAYYPTNASDVNFGLKDQHQSFLPQNAGYNNQPQSAISGCQSQHAAYGYQPTNAADFATNDFPNSNRNYLGTAANSAANIFPTYNGNYSGSATYLAANYSLSSNGTSSGCAVYSATNNFPTLNKNYAGISALPAINDLTTSNGNYSKSATYSAENKTSNGNYSGSTTISALHNFTTCLEKYSGSKTYPLGNNLPTSNRNYSGTAAHALINDLTKSKGSGTAYHSVINGLASSKGNYSGNVVNPVINSLTPCEGNYSGSVVCPMIDSSTSSEGDYSGSVAYAINNDFTTNGNYSGAPTYPAVIDFTTSKGNHRGSSASVYYAVNELITSDERYSGNIADSGTNNLPTSNQKKYSGTEHLEDLSAALAALGNNCKSLMEIQEEDPVDDYMNWYSPEPNAQEVGLGFTKSYGQNN